MIVSGQWSVVSCREGRIPRLGRGRHSSFVIRHFRILAGCHWRLASVRREHGQNARATPRRSLLAPRNALTLVELLITIAIIAILAGMVLGVSAVAAETAREARTRQLITRLHTLLIERYDSYKSRRVNVRASILASIDTTFSTTTGSESAKSANARRRIMAAQEARLHALRELMLMEMPDRWSDVNLAPQDDVEQDAVFYSEGGNTRRTALSVAYWRRLDRMRNSVNKLTGQTNTPEEIVANQGAECLYMIIMLSTADGEAPSMFNENLIGDTDGDGAPEFLDGWGRPIHFIRWAPGFSSQVQMSPARIDEIYTDQLKKFASDSNPTEKAMLAVDNALAADHDPFDMYGLIQNISMVTEIKDGSSGDKPIPAYRLVPLIYSDGGDEESGLETGDDWDETGTPVDDAPWAGTVTPQFNTQPFYTAPLYNTHFILNWTPNPYRKNTSSPTVVTYVGQIIDPETAADNIHNHLITVQ
jgi:prepilin-type N-terminal cleavage/methylation domain-containing protein